MYIHSIVVCLSKLVKSACDYSH